MNLRHLRRVLLFVVVVATTLVVPGRASADVGPISFAGEGVADAITGTFTLDQFTVKTPIDYGFVVPPQPHLVAVGTVTAQVTSFFTGETVFTVTDAPFDWVELSVAATCGGSVTITFDEITGGDYLLLHGEPAWDPSVPMPLFPEGTPSRFWYVDAQAPLVLTANGGLVCALARAVAHNDLSVEATTLNVLLRQEAAKRMAAA
jgi:hypothetical protein